MLSFKQFLAEGKGASKLAATFHDEWRANYNASHGGKAPPRIKKTKDEKWIKKHGSDEVDISSTKYEHLPKDWKHENHQAAKAAWKVIDKHRKSGGRFNKKFIEGASDHVHKQWLKRNGAWAPEHQKVDYAHLSDEEKEKDRKQVRTAISVYKKANKSNKEDNRIARIKKSEEKRLARNKTPKGKAENAEHTARFEARLKAMNGRSAA